MDIPNLLPSSVTHVDPSSHGREEYDHSALESGDDVAADADGLGGIALRKIVEELCGTWRLLGEAQRTELIGAVGDWLVCHSPDAARGARRALMPLSLDNYEAEAFRTSFRELVGTVGSIKRSGPVWEKHVSECAHQAEYPARRFRRHIQVVVRQDERSVSREAIGCTLEYWRENRRKGVRGDAAQLVERTADQMAAYLSFRNVGRATAGDNLEWWYPITRRAVAKILWPIIRGEKNLAGAVPDAYIDVYVDAIQKAPKFVWMGLGAAIHYLKGCCLDAYRKSPARHEVRLADECRTLGRPDPAITALTEYLDDTDTQSDEGLPRHEYYRNRLWAVMCDGLGARRAARHHTFFVRRFACALVYDPDRETNTEERKYKSSWGEIIDALQRDEDLLFEDDLPPGLSQDQLRTAFADDYAQAKSVASAQEYMRLYNALSAEFGRDGKKVERLVAEQFADACLPYVRHADSRGRDSAVE